MLRGEAAAQHVTGPFHNPASGKSGGAFLVLFEKV
jgi:hypothetical protein